MLPDPDATDRPDAGIPCRNPAHREVLERMVTEQPERLVRKMRRAADASADAEDLAQEVLVRAVRSLAGLRGPADEALVCGWVDTIADNLVRNHHRARSRRPRVDAVDATDVAELGDAPARPGHGDHADHADHADRIAADDALAALVARLPAGQREVFVARVVDERSTAEVARDLGIGEDLVRWRLLRARERLRLELDRLT